MSRESDENSKKVAKKVLEDGCSSATFAPGGTAAGETRVEQQDGIAEESRNIRDAKGEE